jgi:hypothetical protein
MAKVEKTSIKRPPKPFTGTEGVRLSATNQPSPERKKLGWQEIRKKRLLTQELIKELIEDDGTPKESFKAYLRALIENAKTGNPKAIDAVNKILEDDVTKIELSGSVGTMINFAAPDPNNKPIE